MLAAYFCCVVVATILTCKYDVKCISTQSTNRKIVNILYPNGRLQFGFTCSCYWLCRLFSSTRIGRVCARASQLLIFAQIILPFQVSIPWRPSSNNFIKINISYIDYSLQLLFSSVYVIFVVCILFDTIINENTTLVHVCKHLCSNIINIVCCFGRSHRHLLEISVTFVCTRIKNVIVRENLIEIIIATHRFESINDV